MKDVSAAARARAAYLGVTGATEELHEDDQLLLDLYTLLVLIKGRNCTQDDIECAWQVAGLRWGPDRPACFDMLDDDADESINSTIASDEMCAVIFAAADLGDPGDPS